MTLEDIDAMADRAEQAPPPTEALIALFRALRGDA